MKQPKQYLYTLLTSTTAITDLVGTRVHFQADDEFVNDYEDKFPMITVYRIGGVPPEKTIKRIDRFQIAVRDNTNLWAEAVAEEVITLLKNRKDDTLKNCFLVGMPIDLYDRSTKASGIAMTFDLIMADPDL